MAQRALEQRVENLEHRVATVEQILPTLATKADIAELRHATKADIAELRDATRADIAELRDATRADIAELRDATKADLVELKGELTTTLRAEWQADLAAAIAPLATKAAMKAEAEQTRRYFDVVAEGLRADSRLLAEGQTAIRASIDANHADIMRVLEQHDRRLMRLEARPKRRSPA